MTIDTRRRWLAIVLCSGLIELASWGSLYYAVPVLHEQISADTGWSVQALSLTYSLSLVLSALLGPAVGRLIDRRGPRELVAIGAVVGSAGLGLVAISPNQLAQGLGMVVVGAGQAATLYPPIFAALTIWLAEDKARALTVVSLFGGASSSIFAPSLAPLVGELEWRGALAVVAAVYVVVTVPAAWFGLRAPWPVPPTHVRDDRNTIRRITKTWRFRSLQVSMVLAGVGLYATTLNLISLARESGYSYGLAATVFGLVGAGQVAGRLLYLPLAKTGSPRGQTLVQVALTAVTIAGLAVAEGSAVLLVCAALAIGAVRGAHTLLMASGVADRWGTDGFGALSGTFNRPVALSIAASPFAGSLLASATGGFVTAAYVLAAAAAVGLVFAWMS